eukprot:7509106-Heterocapsa_arctica.AAC.1
MLRLCRSPADRGGYGYQARNFEKGSKMRRREYRNVRHLSPHVARGPAHDRLQQAYRQILITHVSSWAVCFEGL